MALQRCVGSRPLRPPGCQEGGSCAGVGASSEGIRGAPVESRRLDVLEQSKGARDVASEAEVDAEPQRAVSIEPASWHGGLRAFRSRSGEAASDTVQFMLHRNRGATVRRSQQLTATDGRYARRGTTPPRPRQTSGYRPILTYGGQGMRACEDVATTRGPAAWCYRLSVLDTTRWPRCRRCFGLLEERVSSRACGTKALRLEGGGGLAEVDRELIDGALRANDDDRAALWLFARSFPPRG